jgi:hypothetical protein
MRVRLRRMSQVDMEERGVVIFNVKPSGGFCSESGKCSHVKDPRFAGRRTRAADGTQTESLERLYGTSLK